MKLEKEIESYGLNQHCTLILEEYREKLPVYEHMLQVVRKELEQMLRDNGLYITALETRIKEEKSLAGKLELKGGKYRSLSDITDILGTRIITFYSDDVDKISALVDRLFTVDWQNSVDKRKMHELDSFGYNSLHYVCRIPKQLYEDSNMPEINELRFEVQMRTALQHVWATMNHDTGYKTGVEVPREYIRSLNRLAGMLELADEQFSTIRREITDYRRQVQALVVSGRFEEVPLNGDTFRSYLEIKPFNNLLNRIAAINQAEIHRSSAMPYLPILQRLEFKTLGDVEKLKEEYSEDAYQLALYQIGNTNLDIISSTLAIQDLLVVYILELGGGERGLELMFNRLHGPSEYNIVRARRLVETAKKLPFMHKPRL